MEKTGVTKPSDLPRLVEPIYYVVIRHFKTRPHRMTAVDYGEKYFPARSAVSAEITAYTARLETLEFRTVYPPFFLPTPTTSWRGERARYLKNARFSQRYIYRNFFLSFSLLACIGGDLIFLLINRTVTF